MSKILSKGVVPKLRFPEFINAGEWEECLLGNLAIISTKKNRTLSEKRVLSNSAADGVVDQRDFFDKDIANKDNLDGYYIVEVGDFVYNPRISNLAPVGPISRNNIGTGVMSPLYTVFRFKTEQTDFFAQFFKSSHWYSYLQTVSNTGARHDRMTISNDTLMAMPIYVPKDKDEQQKIADCLFSLDELITAQGKKADALRTYKKSILQQLFPQDGRTIPTLRFSEFKNSGGWEEKKVGDYLKESLIKGNSGDVAKKLTVKLWGKGVFEKIQTLKGSENTKYYTRKSGQFIYSKLDFLNQAFGIIPDHLNNFETTVDLPCFDISKELDAKFFLEYVMREAFYKKYGETADGSRKAKRIHADVFLEFPILLPTLKEQQKISGILSTIDNYILSENQCFEILKAHKKGLLQQLFPIAEGKGQ